MKASAYNPIPCNFLLTLTLIATPFPVFLSGLSWSLSPGLILASNFMRGVSAFWGIFFWLLGLSAFTSLLPILTSAQRFFAKNEAYYRPPVYTKTATLILRRDAYGKGFFGASRNGRRVHEGIDILAPVGEPVLAAKSGRVTFSGWGKGYGQYISIYHADGLKTIYAHLATLYVSKGDWVTAGERIGVCGKTGNASDPLIKPHLHFEIRTSLGPVNPGSGLFAPCVVIRKS